MTFDDVLVKHVGDFGLYQKVQLILVCIPTLFLAMHSLSWTFTGASLDYRCLLLNESSTDEMPFSPKNNENYSKWVKDNHCQRPVNFTIGQPFTENDALSLETCVDGFKWDTRQIKSSAVKRWNFVCRTEWLKALVHSFYYVGQFFGSAFFGIYADILGRKPTFFIASFIQVVCGISMAFVPYWPLFTFLRFLLGFAHPGVYLTAVVVVVEMLGPSRRILSTVVSTIFFSAGQITLAGIAYAFPYYEHLQLAISIPVALFVVYWWLVPESARWLVSRNRIEEAEKILRTVAHWNKRNLPDNWFNEVEFQEKKENGKNANEHEGTKSKANFWEMFRNPYIRKNILVLFVCWPIVSMAYYGLAMNPGFMGGDRYLSFVVGGVFDILAAIVLKFTLNILGRKFIGVSCFVLAAAFLVISVLVPTDFSTIRMLCVALGKMCITGVYGVLYIFTPELFPTVIRMSAVGACSMIARLGGFLASYVFLYIDSMYMQQYFSECCVFKARIYPAPVAISLSATCILAASLIFLLPETNGHSQIETVEEAEALAREKQTMFIFSWQKKNQTSVK